LPAIEKAIAKAQQNNQTSTEELLQDGLVITLQN
jgi:hypothetical protein